MAAESLLQVIELFPGPALIIGPGGDVVGLNDRMEGWIGLTRDELRGRPLSQLVAEPPERVAGFLDDCTQGGRKVAATLTPRQGDGAGGECRVEGIAVPSRPGGTETPLSVVHVIPVEPGAAAAATTATREALEEELRCKDELLGRLAHDLRNPVAAISSALHLARGAASREDLAWAQDTIERQLKHLVRQIDDLQDLSSIARGKIELRKQRLDAAAVARAAAAAVRPLIDERQHQLTLSASPGPLLLDADPGAAGADPRQAARPRRQVHRPGGPDPALRDARAGHHRLPRLGQRVRCGRPIGDRQGHRAGAGPEARRAAGRLGLRPQRQAGRGQ